MLKCSETSFGPLKCIFNTEFICKIITFKKAKKKTVSKQYVLYKYVPTTEMFSKFFHSYAYLLFILLHKSRLTTKISSLGTFKNVYQNFYFLVHHFI